MITYAIGREVVAAPKATSDPSESAERWHQMASLVSEVAERLEEIDTVRLGFGVDLMRRLCALHGESPVGYRFVLQVLHGDTSHLTESFRTRGEARGKTKQDMHWEQRQLLAKIAVHFPEVSGVLADIRAQVEAHEDAASRADLLRRD